LGVTPILVCLGVPWGGHGSYGPLALLFPYTMLLLRTHLIHSNVALILPIVFQFPVYGIILGFANAKRKLIPVACLLLVIHALGIRSNYAFYYYGHYKSLHDPNNQLLEAVRNDDLPTAKRLLDEGVDPNFHRAYGGPPSLLGLACMDGHLEMAKLLLENGADVNYREPHQGDTALFNAVGFKHEQIVELLLSKGVDVTVKDSNGYTVLERAKQRRESRETSLKRTKREPEDIAEELKPDDRIISLLESATKAQKKP
jgi:hypothetical protein